MLSNTQFWDDLAIQSYKAILKRKPDHAVVHKNLGLAYMRTGKVNKAARSFQRAVKHDKEFTEAYYHLGRAYQLMGKSPEAVRYFNKYQKLTAQTKAGVPVVQELLDQLHGTPPKS